MKHKSLLDGVAIAVVLVAGVSELAQVPAIAVRLAQRRAAPLVRLAQLGHTPSSPELPLPAARPALVEARACPMSKPAPEPAAQDDFVPPVHFAPFSMMVKATMEPVETVADPVAARAFVAPNPAVFARVARVRASVDQRMIERAIAAQQREVERLMARARAQRAEAETTVEW